MNKCQGNILIVDDTPANLRLLSGMLTEQGYEVRAVKKGRMAIKAVRTLPPDLILLDIMMPDMDGYQVCQQLKADAATCEIPVIFLSALDEVIDKVKAFEVGGVDYISKPFHLQEVLVRVKNQISLSSAKAKIKQLNQELEQRVRNRTIQLETANQQLKQEIAQREKYQKELVHRAFHDNLTGMPNRAFFLERLNQALKYAKIQQDYLFGVLFLDCDRFKVINDSLGHLMGDQLMIAVARRLKSCLRPNDTIARLGGDEFAILIDELEDISSATTIAQRIHKALNEPFWLEEHKIFINASVGIVLGTKDYQQPETILRDADTAMYCAKELGKGRYQVFETQMRVRAQKILQLETDLRRAIARQEFFVHYQPIVSLITGKITGFEALVRWHHPEKGMVSPGEFIPLAEETGLIIPIGMLVLREACCQLHYWQNQYLNKNLTISVNLSVKQFYQPDLIDQIDKILAETQLEGSSLKLEITESVIMDNAESVTTILEQLKSRQIQLSIDDFGTGYSSLSYLHRFPVDTLKIDRSFINRVDRNDENLKIIQAIVTLAHNLGMDVVAEGVETNNQADQLKAIGCESAQGYFFFKPLDNKSAESVLEGSG